MILLYKIDFFLFGFDSSLKRGYRKFYKKTRNQKKNVSIKKAEE